MDIERINSPQTVSAETARLTIDIMATVGHLGPCDELKALARKQFILVVDLDTVKGLSGDLIDGRTHGAVYQNPQENGDTQMVVAFKAAVNLIHFRRMGQMLLEPCTAASFRSYRMRATSHPPPPLHPQ